MTLTTVVLLILIGLLVILAEIFFVPGSTIVGVVGIALVLVGIVGAFYWLDRTMGFTVFGSTLLILAVLTWLGFKTKTWQRFAVKSSINSKAPADTFKFSVGQQGVTLTRCTPIGKAQFGSEIEEVYSSNDYIEINIPVEIIRIQENKLIVKPITTTLV
jgi:membrane-bound ClpP family serine protease